MHRAFASFFFPFRFSFLGILRSSVCLFRRSTAATKLTNNIYKKNPCSEEWSIIDWWIALHIFNCYILSFFLWRFSSIPWFEDQIKPIYSLTRMMRLRLSSKQHFATPAFLILHEQASQAANWYISCIKLPYENFLKNKLIN